MDHPHTGVTAVLDGPGPEPAVLGRPEPGRPEPAPAPDRGPTAGDSSSARSIHRLAVVTPEGVLLEFRAAGVGSRMLAIFIDVIIQFVAIVALLFLTAFIVLGAGASAGIVVVVVAVFLIIYGYPAVSEAVWDGRTVGKALLGIRVITTEGAPVAFRHTAVRAMLTTVDFWLPTPGGLVALTSALTTRRSQRLGDLAAGTIVVRRVKARPSPVFFAPAHGAEQVAHLIDTSALTPAQYALIRDVVLRAPELEPHRLVALADDLAAHVGRLTGTPRPPWLDSHRYLVSVLHAHQARFRPAAPPMAPPPMAPPMVGMGAPGPGLAQLPPPVGPPVGPPVAGPGWNSR